MIKSIFRVIVIILLTENGCKVLTKSLPSMDMYCTAKTSGYGEMYNIVEDGYFIDTSCLVSYKFDYLDCYYEMSIETRPFVNVKLGINNKNSTIEPFVNKPITFLENYQYKGNFSISFGCFRKGNSEINISLSIEFEDNNNNINFTLHFTKECDYTMKNQYIYINQMTDKNNILNQGFIGRSFNPYNNDDMFVDNSSSITYIILKIKPPKRVTCDLMENNNKSILIKEAYLNNVIQVIELLFSGEANRHKVYFHCCYKEREDRFTNGIPIYNPKKYFYFSFIKNYQIGPNPGFDVLLEKNNYISNYIYVAMNDGIVQSPFIGNDEDNVILSSNELSLVLEFKSRFGFTNIANLIVKGDDIDISIIEGVTTAVISVGKEFHNFTIYHKCNENGIKRVKVSFDVINAENKTNLSFSYKKDCRKYLISITAGMYISTEPDSYAVKNGIVSPGYVFGYYSTRVNWGEKISHFYIENEGNEDLVISYPKLINTFYLYDLECIVRVIGYNKGDQITLNKENGPIIMELKYYCKRLGEYHIIIDILIENTPLTFSFIKVCDNNVKTYSVRTTYEDKYYSENQGCSTKSLIDDVVYNGNVQKSYKSYDPRNIIDPKNDYSIFYFAADIESSIDVKEKPRVISSNKYICEVEVSGSIYTITTLSMYGNDLELNFICKKTGIVKIDVIFNIGKRYRNNDTTTFSMYKRCYVKREEGNSIHYFAIPSMIIVVFLFYRYIVV